MAAQFDQEGVADPEPIDVVRQPGTGLLAGQSCYGFEYVRDGFGQCLGNLILAPGRIILRGVDNPRESWKKKREKMPPLGRAGAWGDWTGLTASLVRLVENGDFRGLNGC
jgi:hypothetical protein